MRLKKPLLFNCPPRHLHVVTLLRTKCVVDDRALAGISEIHEPRRMKDGWWKSPTLRDGVSLKTPGGRQRETTSLISQVTDDGTNISYIHNQSKTKKLDGTPAERRLSSERNNGGKNGGEERKRKTKAKTIGLDDV